MLLKGTTYCNSAVFLMLIFISTSKSWKKLMDF